MMRREFWFVFIALLAAAITVLSFYFNYYSGLIMLVTLLVIAVSGIFFARRRRRTIKQLSAQLRRLLSGDYHVDLAKYEEGELAVLSADLYKLMIALREQASNLVADKTWLADSISDISHQLKTPITSMMMLTDLLKKDLEPERRKQFLQQLSNQIDRLQWLVRNLLTLSKLDAQAVIYSPETISYRELFERSVEPLLINMELKHQPLAMAGDLDQTLEIDGNWMAEALTNIIKNASDHGPLNSSIQLQAYDRPMSKTIEIINQGEIDPRDLPHLFTRFYRGRHAGTDSVGIGLAISRAIVLQQAGQIEVENPPGQTIFRIRFPK